MVEAVVLPNGTEGERIPIESANPVSYYQAISESDDLEPVEIESHLFLPSGKGPWPTVILVPGSLGISENNLKAAALLTKIEIAACLINPFKARGVSSTVSNQTQYSFAASAWDVLSTARTIRTLSSVDSARIGSQGHSRGGTAVLSAACMAQLIEAFKPVSFLGVFAAYPWCGHQFLNPIVGNAVIRSVIGDLDEWCLPQQVQAYMNAMRLSGIDAEWRIFPNAHHSFDRDIPLDLIEDAAVAPSAPTVYVADDGAMIHPISGKPNPNLSERELMIYSMKAGYGKKGARIGTIGNEASLFREYLTEFWQSTMNFGR